MTRSGFLAALPALILASGIAHADIAPDSDAETMGMFLELRGAEAVFTRAPPPQSAAARAGLTRNDVVLALNRIPIAQVPRRQFDRLGWGDAYDCLVRIRRGRRVLEVQVRRGR